MDKNKDKKQPNSKNTQIHMKKKDVKMDKAEEHKKAVSQRNKKKLIAYILAVFAIAVLAFALWKLSKVGDSPSDKLVFQVGTEKVYQDEVNLCFLQNVLYHNITADVLEETTAEDGSSLADSYKESILQLIMDYKVEYMIAVKQGLELSEEEQEAYRSEAMEYLSKVNGTTMNRLGITQDCILRVYGQRYLARKLEKTVIQDIAIEDQNYCTLYLLLFPKVKMQENGDYEREEDGETPVMLSKTEMEKRKKDADAAYEELLAGADIEAIADKYGIAEVSGEESNLADSFEEPFSQYAKSLKKDEYTPVLETESYYAIAKMVTVNDEETAQQILQYYKADLEADTIEEYKKKWYEEAGVDGVPDFAGTVWENISMYDFVQ